MFKRPVHTSTLVLTGIALLDLLTTLVFFKMGGKEANGIFRWFLHYGIPAFIGGKVLFLATPIVILEYARQFKPKSAEQGTWLAVILYCAFYGMNVVALNFLHK